MNEADPFRVETADGDVTLVPSTTRTNGWSLTMNGVFQSFVDLDDPEHMQLAFLRGLAGLLDWHLTGGGGAGAGARGPVLHVGGGSLAVPRRVAVRHPHVRQIVAEPNETLLAVLRERLPWEPTWPIEVLAATGEQVIEGVAGGSLGAVVLDAYVGPHLVDGVQTPHFLGHVRRVLCRDGVVVANVTEPDPGVARTRRLARRVAAALGTGEAHVVAVAAALRDETPWTNGFVIGGPTAIDVADLAAFADQQLGLAVETIHADDDLAQ